jgi:hypothetical protein
MMSGILRCLVVALALLAFASGMTVEAIPSAQAHGLSVTERGAKANPECPRMAMDHSGDSIPMPLPCKGIMLDCVKQMGCLGVPALPDRSGASVCRWRTVSLLTGRLARHCPARTSSPISFLP